MNRFGSRLLKDGSFRFEGLARKIRYSVHGHCQIDVLDIDARGDVQGCPRKIQNASDTGVHKHIRHKLSFLVWNRNDANSDALFSDDTCRSFYGVAGAAVNQAAELVRIGFKRGDDFEGWPAADEKLQKGAPDIADTGYYGPLLFSWENKCLDMIAQFFDVVSLRRSAGVSDNHQVAPHLGGRDSGFSRKVVRINVVFTFTRQISKYPPVKR